ncbi:MAG: hypothetical protein N2169_07105 [bacterium]|nr:hypothetical protein [bacterium]
MIDNPLLSSVVGIAIGAITGLAVSELFTRDKMEQTKTAIVFRKVVIAIVGATIGHIAVLSVQLQFLLNDVKYTMSHPTPYDEAEDWISKQYGATRELFQEKLEELRTRLLIITKGEILVSRDEVFNVWIRGFELMKPGDIVYATNIVSEGDWKYFGPEGGGRKTQEDAIKRGVTIQRIMLYDPNDLSHRNGLIRLASLHAEVGVQVKELDINWLETPTYQGWLQLLGTSDIVLFGDSFLLLTYIHPKTKSILRSEVTTNKEKINAAKAFYQRIWKDAKTIEIKKNKWK